MSERYSKLFALSENQYASGSPVVIAAGALLKDNQTGKVVAQIKLRSIDARRIKAAMVCVIPFDTVGNPIGDSVRYQYLDLNVARNEEFGQKVAIALPNPSTRSFAVTVEEVVFATNTVWSATGEPWEVLPVPSSIGRIHGAEFEKQFRMKYGADSKNLPLFEKDFWYCACGALNRIGEHECHICGKSYAKMRNIDFDALHREKNVRVAAEKAQAEKEAEAARAREEAARSKAKKAGKIMAILAPIFAVIIVAALIVSGMMKRNDAYDNALALMDAGQYEEAIKAFTSLDGYKDSADQIKAAEDALAEIALAAEVEETYNNAIQLLESNVSANENEAYHILMELGDYKDVAELLANFQYQVIAEENDKSERIDNYEYDAFGNKITENKDVGYRYYENGSPKSIQTQITGGTITAFFDENGVLKTVKNKSDMTGAETTWSFDGIYFNDSLQELDCTYTNADNEIVAVKHLDFSSFNGTVTFDYLLNPTRIVIICVDVSGRQESVYEIKYVSSQNEITITESEKTEYDDNGNPVRINATYFENMYDENDNLIQVIRTLPDGTKTTYSYIYGYIYTPDAE